MMTKAERIAQRCKWEYERAEERGETRVAQVLAYCPMGATHGPMPIVSVGIYPAEQHCQII